MTTSDMVWADAFVEEVIDFLSDIVECDAPPCSQEKIQKINGSMRDSGNRGKNPPREKNKKFTKKKLSSILRASAQGIRCFDEESDQEQDTPSEFVNVVAYNEEGDVNVIRHVKIENPPCSVKLSF
ncbi:hypothetical protein Plhal304r1_c013g0049221 [Plasmopara halstedii]